MIPPSSYSTPAYVRTTFKDISNTLRIYGTSRVLIIQDCECAYELLGSLTLLNVPVTYQLIKDTVKVNPLDRHILITDGKHQIQHGSQIKHGKTTLYLRDK